jgi:hypothetical protein
MHPDPLSFPSLPADLAQPARTAAPAEGELSFAARYAEQMQAAQEIAQIDSSPETTASNAASPIDGLLSFLELRASWNPGSCGANSLPAVPDGLDNQLSGLQPVQGRNAAKRNPWEATPDAKEAEANSANQQDASTHTSSGIGRIISWLDAHAHLHSTHHCAASVRQAMEAAGIPTAGRPGDAGDYGPFLVQHGARTVDPSSYEPHVGDIAVFDKSEVHPAGHIQVFNGQHWVSDFVQQGFSPYRDAESTPPVTVYRLS